MKTTYIDHYRDSFGEKTTEGKLYIDDGYFCETLEDKVRKPGEKVYGETAIPENKDGYLVDIVISPKFGEVVSIYTHIGKNGERILEYGGIKFESILAHGGNRASDTLGCVLVAKNRVSDDVIQGSMKEELVKRVKALIKNGYEVKWRVFNHKR